MISFLTPLWLPVCLALASWFMAIDLNAQTPVDNVSPNRVAFHLDGHTLEIPYYRNYSLEDTNRSVDRAVVVIHGTSRNADDYYDRVLKPARSAGHADRTTIIVAPQFLRDIDISAHRLPKEVLYWTNSGWKRGDKSRDTSQPRLSSFAVIDTILYRLATTNPNLQTIVLAGHSAGGQFVNRYAAGTRMEQILSASHGIHIRYLVANPSSYLYFNEERRVEGTLDQFAVPTGSGCQSSYNDYKYGLDDLNSYMSEVGRAQLRAQYRQREVIYLLGEDDNNPNHSSLDKSCPARLQGAHRLERGIIYYNYLRHYFGSDISGNQMQAIVPNVGHSSTGMFASHCGVYFLFDYGHCDDVTSVADRVVTSSTMEFRVRQNYPNPFNPLTTIQFSLPAASPVFLDIYDLRGELVRSLLSGETWPAGGHTVSWDGTNGDGKKVASGIYLYRLDTRTFREAKRMAVLR